MSLRVQRSNPLKLNFYIFWITSLMFVMTKLLLPFYHFIMNNNWFEFSYRNYEEINSNINKISNFSIIELVIFIVVIIWWIFLVLYILPTFKWLKKEFLSKKEKENKKIMLKQIVMQKEIEEEIEKELEAEKQMEINKKLWF